MKRFLTHPFFWLQIICLCIIYFSFQKFLLLPNDYIFNQWGDGIKNYFTPAWFIQYDNGNHFTGMAYPFGEHVVYTDNQPALSWILNFIDEHIISISQYTVGIINLLMLFSLLFTAMLMFKILVHYSISPWWAVASAIIITFMNPQLQRMGGHYALSYSFYIPLLWWMSIQAKKRNYRYLPVFILIFLITFFGFIHLYYAFIGLLFFSTYFLVSGFKKIANRREILAPFAIIIIPFLIIFSFLHFTDTVEDRTPAPYGFFAYRATLQSVFLPREGVFADLVYNNTSLRRGDIEGYAYVGGIASMIALISIITFIIRSVKQKTFKAKIIETPPRLSVYVLAAILSLLFSFAFPFILGLRTLPDVIPFIKQFRSLGRFAWIFYYVFTVYAVVYVYTFFQKIYSIKKIAAYLFITFLLAFSILETNVNFVRNKKLILHTSNHNPFKVGSDNWKEILVKNNSSADDFQATLFLGFFLNGSEKLYVDRSAYDGGKAMEIAYQTGLPLINSMMSRTSVSQTLQLAQVVSHSTIKKTYPMLISKKDILLITNDKEITRQEKYLLANSKFICQEGHLKLYAMPVSILDDTQHFLQEDFIHKKQTWYFNPVCQYYAEKPIQLFYSHEFEQNLSPEPFYGKGSFYSENGGGLVAEIPVQISEVIWIEVSVWAKTYAETTAYPYMKVKFIDAKNKIIKETSVNPKFSTDVINAWVRAAENFDVPPECKKIILEASNDKMINFDNLLVRHTAYDVIYAVVNDSTFTFNNYPIGK
ncbi:MAG: hypothetical protein ACKVPJ_12935 [Chitinophagales bacterium]